MFGINHIICPNRDHSGNGKIERLIRTINDRLRTNRQIILGKDKSGLSEILYFLRISKKKDGKSPFGVKTQEQGEAKTPEVAIEFDEGRPPSSNTTENEIPTKESTKEIRCKTEDDAPKELNKPKNVAIPVKTTTSWQIDRRVSERKHVPSKRHGIDLISKYQEEEEKKASGKK